MTDTSKPLDPTHISELVPDPENRRQHNPRNIGMIADALRQVGAARSIVIDENHLVLAGNGVTEGAAEAGITKVRVIDAEGDELIAVRRSGLTPEQKRALALYDNRTSELAEWNAEQLQADQAAGLDLTPWFSDAELGRLLPAAVKEGLTDPDAVPDQRATGIVAGDLFRLGSHSLLCGDATAGAAVSRLLGPVRPHLMVTDPPYGVEYDARWRLDAGLNKIHQKRAEGRVGNDDRSDWRDAWRLFQGTVAYVWHGGLHASEVADGLLAAGLVVRSQIIWAKPSLVIGRGHYHWQHEPCWYAVRKGATATWAGDRKQSTLWTIANMHATQGSVDDGKTNHSTQKPVECMRRPMENNSSVGQAIYDPFVGSGTSLIAAEQIGRSCYAIELNPSYVQVVIDRWEAFTGQKAEKVGEVEA